MAHLRIKTRAAYQYVICQRGPVVLTIPAHAHIPDHVITANKNRLLGGF